MPRFHLNKHLKSAKGFDDQEGDEESLCSSRSRNGETLSIASKHSTISLPTLNFSRMGLGNRSNHSNYSADDSPRSPLKGLRKGRRPNYDKFECPDTSDQFDLSILEELTSQELSPRKKNHESFATEATADMDHSDCDSLDEGPIHVSPTKCHIPAHSEGLAQFMINTDDPTHGTIWVQSPDGARPHLELNIQPGMPKTEKPISGIQQLYELKSRRKSPKPLKSPRSAARLAQRSEVFKPPFL